MGHVLFWADELTDENGKIDFEKGEELAKKRLEDRYSSLYKNRQKVIPESVLYTKPVVSYDMHSFEYKYCGVINDLCEKNQNLDRRKIAKTASGNQYFYGGKIYIFEEDITEYDSKGNKFVNVEKGRNIAKERMETRRQSYVEGRKLSNN